MGQRSFRLANMTMACALSSLPVTLATIVGLMCDLDRLQMLVQHDAAPDQPFATDCLSIETLDESGDHCKQIFVWPHGNFTKLYNESKAERFLEMLSLQNMPCECTTFSAAVDCERCHKLSMLKELGSPGRENILRLHKKRSAEANVIRQQHAFLQSSARLLKNHLCQEHPEECKLAKTLATTVPPLNFDQHSDAEPDDKVYTYTY